jgi:hypothetical protein
VVEIRELAIRLLALFIGAILVLLAAVYLDHTIVPADEGAANNVTDIALKTALKDPSVAQELSQPDFHYTATINPVNADSEKGYLNGPVNLMDVKIQVRYSDWGPPYRFDVLVDIDQKRNLDTIGMADIGIGQDFMTIPSGSAWFYHIVHANRTGRGTIPPPPLLVGGSYSPMDASVLLAMVDSTGFGMLRNASLTGDLRNVDLSGHALWLNRSNLAGPGWNASIDVPYVNTIAPVYTANLGGVPVIISYEPALKPADDYYIVIVNEGSREVTATFSPDETTWF